MGKTARRLGLRLNRDILRHTRASWHMRYVVFRRVIIISSSSSNSINRRIPHRHKARVGTRFWRCTMRWRRSRSTPPQGTSRCPILWAHSSHQSTTATCPITCTKTSGVYLSFLLDDAFCASSSSSTCFDFYFYLVIPRFIPWPLSHYCFFVFSFTLLFYIIPSIKAFILPPNPPLHLHVFAPH